MEVRNRRYALAVGALTASMVLLTFARAWPPLVAAARAPMLQAEDGLPEGYEQILPRGRIAAIDDPTFVTASEAEIDDDAWVLGVVIEGEARAYSLNLLNAHEVVNDRIGDTGFAAVW